MDETKTCQNCKHWVEKAVWLDLSSEAFNLYYGRRQCAELSDSVIAYQIGEPAFQASNRRNHNAFIVTEPDFCCTKFEPQGDLK